MPWIALSSLFSISVSFQKLPPGASLAPDAVAEIKSDPPRSSTQVPGTPVCASAPTSLYWSDDQNIFHRAIGNIQASSIRVVIHPTLAASIL